MGIDSSTSDPIPIRSDPAMNEDIAPYNYKYDFDPILL